MQKNIAYIIGGAVLLLLIVVLMASRGKPLRRMDERITLRQRDKIPYGTAVAKHLLPSLFPRAALYTDNRYPGAWDNIAANEANQAVILVADFFSADEEEMQRLNNFVANGNTVFLIARSFSDAAANFLRMNFSSHYNYLAATDDDSLLVRLEQPAFSSNSIFSYPGKKYEGRIHHRDTARAVALGSNGFGGTNFVQLRKDKGYFFIHTSPLAFSNYFILHKQNVRYYQQALSVIPRDVKAVLWNEYFLEKLNNPSDKGSPNWLAALLKVPSFKWGLLTAMAFLLLYMLLGMRRKQRVIPSHEKPSNDSMDFVKTLGRLYFDRGDHRNLAQKMSAYFLEHVRTTYKMSTHTLDDDFVRTLHIKSGYPEPEVKRIIATIKQVEERAAVSEEQLAYFHRDLELFYQNT